MKKIFATVLLLFCAFSSGCIQENTNVDVTVKQVIPLTPGAYVEISKDLNMSELSFESPQDYIPTNSTFQIPIVISNNKQNDFENVQVELDSSSPIIDNLYLYSYSGHAFEKIGDNVFKFDNKLLAKQNNEIMIMGKCGPLQQNLIEGAISFTLHVYGENGDGQLNQISSTTKTLKIRSANSNA